MLNLTVASGPDKGRVFTLLDRETRILGRGEGPRHLSDRTASRNHVKFMWREGQWFVADLGSTNGTFHNGQRLAEEQAISDGDQIQVGCTLLIAGLISHEDATVAGNVAVIRPRTPTFPQRAPVHGQGQHHDMVSYHAVGAGEGVFEGDGGAITVAGRGVSGPPLAAYPEAGQPAARQAGPLVGWILVALTVLALLVLIFDIYFNQKRQTQQMLEMIIKEVRQPQPSQDFSPLVKDLKEVIRSQSSESSQRTEAMLGEIRQLVKSSSDQPQTEALLKQVLVAVERGPQQNSEETEALLKQVLAVLNESRQEPAGQTDAVLQQVLAELRQRPQLAAGSGADLEEKISTAISSLKDTQSRSREEIIEGVRRAVAESKPAQASPTVEPAEPLNAQMLAQILEELRAQRQVIESMPAPGTSGPVLAVEQASGARGGGVAAAGDDEGRGLGGAVQSVAKGDRSGGGAYEPMDEGRIQGQAWAVSDRPGPAGGGAARGRTVVEEPFDGGVPAAAAGAAQGSGEGVVYLVDASGSLIDSMPRVLLELHNSLDQLGEGEKFTVIFFQRDRIVEVPPVGLKRADLKTIAQVKAWTNLNTGHVVPGGYSNPISALMAAMNYRPRSIYLFSDTIAGSGPGEVSHAQLLRVVDELNPQHAVAINTVQFFYPDPNGTLEAIARAHRGRYEFVEESKPVDLPTSASSAKSDVSGAGSEEPLLLDDELIDLLLNESP